MSGTDTRTDGIDFSDWLDLPGQTISDVQFDTSAVIDDAGKNGWAPQEPNAVELLTEDGRRFRIDGVADFGNNVHLRVEEITA